MGTRGGADALVVYSAAAFFMALRWMAYAIGRTGVYPITMQSQFVDDARQISGGVLIQRAKKRAGHKGPPAT